MIKMTKIYGEFGIEIYDKCLVKQSSEIMSLLGKIDIKNTRKNTVIFDYNTEIITTPFIEEVSDILCEKLEPFVEKFANFYSQNKDKCYMEICFVISDLGEEGISIEINHRLLKLATTLGVKICFDGL